ncbi:MAG: zinc ribbon domain-containing protein [Anaerolineae bacterium]|nr:zinc ribbon domain-containing protein [Anaerolineae bacterium]
MPSYDFRCNQCGRATVFTYRTYQDYDEAAPVCPHCGSSDLTRIIGRVAVARPARNYEAMSSSDMLNVLEGGDSHEIGQMFQQVGAGVPAADGEYHEVTNRLLKGEKPESIESDLHGRSDQQISKDQKLSSDG